LAAAGSAAPAVGAGIAGIAAGGALGALCCALGVAALLWRRRQKRGKEGAAVAPQQQQQQQQQQQLAKGEEGEGEGEVPAPKVEEGEEEHEEFALPSAPSASEDDAAAAAALLLAPPAPLMNAFEGLVARARGIRKARRALSTGAGAVPDALLEAEASAAAAAGAPPQLAVAGLALAAAAAKGASDAAEAAAGARRERLRVAQAAAAAHKKSEWRAEVMALPRAARAMLVESRGDTRKWWSAPRVPPKQSKRDGSKWGPLEREKAGVLAGGGVWPPPDPLIALLESGEGRLVNGQVVSVVTVMEEGGGGKEEREREREREREGAAKRGRVALQRAREGLRGGLLAGVAERAIAASRGEASAEEPTAVDRTGTGASTSTLGEEEGEEEEEEEEEEEREEE
jgi:hypothetical protein